MVNKINEHLEKQASNRDGQLESLNKELKEADSQIHNIVNAIARGLFQQAFKDKMDALEKRKSKLEIQIKEIEIKSFYNKITEDQVKNLFSLLKGFVTDRNLPACKKFIHDYVHRVNVFKDRVK